MKAPLNFLNFNPKIIPFQERVLYHFDRWNFLADSLLMLFSGTIGSAKSTLAAHIAVRHCLRHAGARGVVGRQKMPDVKRTIRKEIIDHMKGAFVEAPTMTALNAGNGDYYFNKSDNVIYFANGSQIMFMSWHEAEWEKFRSLNISFFIIEEGTENREKHWPVVDALTSRLGRQSHIDVNFGIIMTNPDGPEHECYLMFIDGAEEYRGRKILKKGNRLTFFSKSCENPKLKPWYIESLRRQYPLKMAQRLLDGEWVSIKGHTIYSHYDQLTHYKKESYQINFANPIHFSFDFNIGEGKPMSMCFFQYIDDVFHFFAEVVVEGADTEELLLEAAGRGHFDHRAKYFYHGDAAGKAKHSASKRSDYDIIENFLSNYRTPDGEKREYIKQVPNSNPPVRTRHNTVNAYCLNGLKEVRLYVWACETLDKAFRLTNLKNGGQYVEDDSKPYQHVGTAAGYGICETLRRIAIDKELERRKDFRPN